LVIGRPFSEQEHRRIRAAIDEVERTTAADLDLVVMRVSDRYSLYPQVWAAVTALILTTIFVSVLPGASGRVALVFEFLVLIAATLIYNVMPVRLRLVPQHVKHAHARQLAHREFAAQYARGGSTRKRILLFVSLGERYVEVIADNQTHGAAHPTVWHQTVSEFVAAVHSGQLAEGVLRAIEACGGILREQHPAEEREVGKEL
jgi:putative membrane protein